MDVQVYCMPKDAGKINASLYCSRKHLTPPVNLSGQKLSIATFSGLELSSPHLLTLSSEAFMQPLGGCLILKPKAHFPQTLHCKPISALLLFPWQNSLVLPIQMFSAKTCHATSTELNLLHSLHLFISVLLYL